MFGIRLFESLVSEEVTETVIYSVRYNNPFESLVSEELTETGRICRTACRPFESLVSEEVTETLETGSKAR